MTTPKTITIDNVEYIRKSDAAAVTVAPGESPLKLGAQVLIRTVTFHYTGKVSLLTDKEIVLSDAAWIADSGRFNNALAKGALNEIEPYPDSVSVNRDTVVDVSLWRHSLPRTVK